MNKIKKWLANHIAFFIVLGVVALCATFIMCGTFAIDFLCILPATVKKSGAEDSEGDLFVLLPAHFNRWLMSL